MKYQIKATNISQFPRASTGQQPAFIEALPLLCDTDDVTDAAFAYDAAIAEFGPTGHAIFLAVDGGEFQPTWRNVSDELHETLDQFEPALRAAKKAGLATEFNGLYTRVAR